MSGLCWQQCTVTVCLRALVSGGSALSSAADAHLQDSGFFGVCVFPSLLPVSALSSICLLLSLSFSSEQTLLDCQTLIEGTPAV